MNMKLIKLFFIVIFGLFMLAVIQNELLAQQQVHTKILPTLNFSGVITDSQNLIVKDGEYSIAFSLYKDKEGGVPLWSELHEQVRIENGEINVELGAGTNPITIPFDKLYYLGIKINGEVESNPRIELVPVPYSIRAVTANNVKDNSITSSKIAPLAVTDDKIESINWNKIKNVPEVNTTIQKSVNKLDGISDLPKYWRRYGNYLETGNEFLGTMNDRNLVIKTDSIQRMLFDPYGKVIMGTVTDSVFFEVIGKTTLGNVYVKNRMGVGADFNVTKARVHIKTTGIQKPFRVDTNGLEVFEISSTGRVKINSQVSGAEDDEKSYAMFVNAEDQGMAIKIDSDESNSNYNYMTFWDEDGIAGRIEGLNAADYFSNPKVIVHDAWFVAQGVALGVAYAASAAGGLELPDIINGTAEVIYWTFQTTWDLTHLGVQYETSSGDYAEWLEKLNTDESFTPGEIVGVFGGKITKNTKNAEQVMCISLSPAVLGNMPGKSREKYFEKVAFKGQVPVKVRGIVHKGDYIIPSGLNDGTGIAVEPNMMTADEFASVIGRAWEDNLNYEKRLVNTAVGLKLNDLAKFIMQSNSMINDQEKVVKDKNKELDLVLTQLNDINNNIRLVKTRMKLLKAVSGFEKNYTINKK